MPIPKKNKDEPKKEFISRCMGDESMVKEYSNPSQRYAICMGQTKASILEQVCEELQAYIDLQDDQNDDFYDDLRGSVEPLTLSNLVIPKDNDYVDFGEDVELFDISGMGKYKYSDPVTNEIYYYDRMTTYRKNGRTLVYIGKGAEHQGKKITLNKPFRTPSGPKKFSVYVKNDKENVVKVNFGDPNMKIKRDDPDRRRNFRARHQCDDNPGPKWKARYWSCKFWSSPKVSDLT